MTRDCRWAEIDMAYDVRVIPVREFLKTRITGEIDLNASRDMLGELMSACKRENMTRILIDTREAISHSTVTDVWTLARDLGSLGVTHENRVAVLNQPKDEFDRAAFLELCAGNRGYHIRAFREFEAAFAWLVSEQPCEADTST
jgi:hypothetical protein